MIKGHLKLVVLKLLSDEALSGYDLMKKICQKTDKKPSAGSIYPLLLDLHTKGLVSMKRRGRRQVYSITCKGRKQITELMKNRDTMIHSMECQFKIFENILSKKELSLFIDVMTRLKKGDAPFKDIFPEIRSFRETIYKFHRTGRYEKNKYKVKEIMQRAIGEISKLK